MLNVEAIRNIIKQKIAQKGYILEERKSSSTNSWYFKIISGNYSLLFRVSDHKTGTKIITLRVDKNTNYKIVERFVENRCNDLGSRVVKSELGI
jgi:hypothetical protein